MARAESKEQDQKHRQESKELFRHFGGKAFTAAMIVAEAVFFEREFKDDQRENDADQWIRWAVRAGLIEKPNGLPKGTFAFRPEARTTYEREDVAYNRLARLPRVSEIEPPLSSPVRSNLDELPGSFSVQEFMMRIVAHLGGIGWVTLNQITEEVTKYQGWNTGRQHLGIEGILKHLAELSLLEEDPRRGPWYRIAAKGAIKFLGWRKSEADEFHLKFPPDGEDDLSEDEPIKEESTEEKPAETTTEETPLELPSPPPESAALVKEPPAPTGTITPEPVTRGEFEELHDDVGRLVESVNGLMGVMETAIQGSSARNKKLEEENVTFKRMIEDTVTLAAQKIWELVVDDPEVGEILFRLEQKRMGSASEVAGLTKEIWEVLVLYPSELQGKILAAVRGD